MLLFDVDDFKSINDTYGHEIGDKALIKIVNTFKKVFRDDDCICRIGGDGLPPISISAGIVSGKNAADIEDLFEKSDKAMYESKMRGKHAFTFYDE